MQLVCVSVVLSTVACGYYYYYYVLFQQLMSIKKQLSAWHTSHDLICKHDIHKYTCMILFLHWMH